MVLRGRPADGNVRGEPGRARRRRAGQHRRDGRTPAPVAATGTWFSKAGKPMETAEAIPGGKSVGVPGNIRLMADAHRDQGRLPWARLFGPAIRLARGGFAIRPRPPRSLRHHPATRALLARPRAPFS